MAWGKTLLPTSQVDPCCQQKRVLTWHILWTRIGYLCLIESEVKWSKSRSVVSNSLRPHGLCSPWNSPGQNTVLGTLSLLQGIFPTQESNRGLLHCRRILYQLSPGEYNLSLVINKNHFYFLSPISISLHFISLVNVGRGDKKMNLSNPQSEGKQSGSQGVPAGAPAGGFSSPSLSFPSECHKGFTIVWSPPGNTHNLQDPSAAYLSPGFSLNRVLVSEISRCCGMVQNRMCPIVKANLSDSKGNFYFLI